MNETVNQLNTLIKYCLQDNDVKTYSLHNEGKSVFAERFIRTLLEQQTLYKGVQFQKYVYW